MRRNRGRKKVAFSLDANMLKLIGLGVLVLAILFVLIFMVNWGMSKNKKSKLLAEGTFLQGVKIEGIDVSGKTYSEVEPQVIDKAKTILAGASAKFQVGDTTYELSNVQLGAQIDYAKTMEEAMFYGRNKSILRNGKLKKAAKENGVDFMLELALEPQILDSSIEELSIQFDTSVKDAEIFVNETRDSEEMLLVECELVITDDVVGRKVDKEKLKKDVVAAVMEGQYDTPIEAAWEESTPSKTKAELEENCTMLASYTTKYPAASAEEMYNVWKLTGLLTGKILEPGETLSLNEVAGEVSEAEGWKVANKVGYITPESGVGGGVSQVASTLYMATLSAELEVGGKEKHEAASLPYAPVGLDANFVPGETDFSLKNTYDVPIYIVARCDGSIAKSVTIEIFGPKKDYYVDIESEVTSEAEPAEAAVVVIDPSMQPGESVWVTERRKQTNVNVYKIKKSKETEEPLGEKELIVEEIYEGARGEQRVGPEPTPDASASGTASPSSST
ncbi:MAG: VanW family protein [Christensenellaceae bacterium]|jgi:vancomycin resistance protein YoaR